jgi:hypothetical protein
MRRKRGNRQRGRLLSLCDLRFAIGKWERAIGAVWEGPLAEISTGKMTVPRGPLAIWGRLNKTPHFWQLDAADIARPTPENRAILF